MFEIRSAAHVHSVSLTSEEALNLLDGTATDYTKSTSEVNGHVHSVTISFDSVNTVFDVVINDNHANPNEHVFKEIGLGPTGPQGIVGPTGPNPFTETANDLSIDKSIHLGNTKSLKFLEFGYLVLVRH